MIDFEKILELFPATEPVVVAYSGGIDSTLVAFLATKRNPGGALAATIVSPLSAEREIRRSRELARELGLSHLEIKIDELTDRGVSDNSSLRCYYCKRLRYRALLQLARERGCRWVMDGSNADDARGHRPGRMAAAELGVRSPLEEAGLGKAMVRQLARELGLPNWDAPSRPCLATRFPTGSPLKREELRRVERGECLLEDVGFSDFRLRSPEPGVALLEISPTELAALSERGVRRVLVEGLRRIGFHTVLLDLDGYREGSMGFMVERRLEVLD